LNFSISRTSLDLIGRRVIKELEGKEDAHSDEYAKPDTDRYHAMVDKIGEKMQCSSLKFQELNDLVNAIGLPKSKLCTHCWDGSSHF
jgi:amidophosphoribosyltransferase